MRLIIITSLLFALSLPGMAQRTKINAARDVTGTLPVANGGTGQTSQQAAIDALLPAQSGHAGEYLKTNGTTASWAADSGTLAIEANGSAVGSQATLNFITGTGISEMVTDTGSKINKTTAINTAVVLTRAQAQSGGDLLCAPASASGANYTCAMTPALSAYTTGMVVQFKPDVSSSAGAVTLNVNGLGSLNIKQSDGTTDPGASALVAGRQVPLTYDGTVLRMGVVGSGGGGMGDPGANGMMARTALNTTTARTITGTANEITVSNGDGVSGNPTLALAGTFDISGKTSTKPVKTGTTAPGTCAVGEMFFDTDATAGQNLYACTATNTWTLQGDGGGMPSVLSRNAPRKISFVEDFMGATSIGGFVASSGSSVVGNTAVAGMAGAVTMTGASGSGFTVMAGGGRVYQYSDDSTMYPMTWYAVVKTPATLDTRFGLMLLHDSGSPSTKQYQTLLEMDAVGSSDTTWQFRHYGSTAGTTTASANTGVTVAANTVYLIGFKITDGSNATWYVQQAGGSLQSGAVSGTISYGGSQRLVPMMFVVGASAADRIMYVDKVGWSNE